MNKGEITTFFFTEFLESLKVKDRFLLFKEFKEIDEVVIPPRSDKRGKKYGYVHFFNVSGERNLVLKLDNLIMEGRKFFANLPRFVRVEKTLFGKVEAKGKATVYIEGGNGKD